MGKASASPFKGPAETSSCQPAAPRGRWIEVGRDANACDQGDGCRQVPTGGSERLRGAGCRPSFSAGASDADQGSGRCWPRPAPGDQQYPPPRPAPGGVRDSVGAGGGLRAHRSSFSHRLTPRPSDPQLPRRTHWPSRAAASAAASARSPRPPPSPPAPAPAPSPWRGRGRSDAAALRALGAAQRRRRRPRGAGRILLPPPPPAPLAVLRLRLGLRARRGRGARHGRGAARGRGPAAGAGWGRGTWHRLPDAWVPLLQLLTSVCPRGLRA